jgi:RNA polymerase sigma-70 factor (ECF subfamily)
MQLSDPDDEDAIAALRRGDVSGLEALVRKYQLRALRAAALIVRDRALAEDVVQAAFLRAYDRIGQFDSNRAFGPWFLRSVVNAAIQAAAREGRHASLDAPVAGDDEAVTLAELLADDAPGPERQAEASELRTAVWQALGRLAPAERGAVVQRYYLDRTLPELAAATRTPPGTLKWRLHQARERLRRWLTPHITPAEQQGERR